MGERKYWEEMIAERAEMYWEEMFAERAEVYWYWEMLVESGSVLGGKSCWADGLMDQTPVFQCLGGGEGDLLGMDIRP